MPKFNKNYLDHFFSAFVMTLDVQTYVMLTVSVSSTIRNYSIR